MFEIRKRCKYFLADGQIDIINRLGSLSQPELRVRCEGIFDLMSEKRIESLNVNDTW